MEKGYVSVRKLARYKLDLVLMQEVRWDKNDIIIARDYIFLKEKKIINWEQDFLYTKLYQQLKEKSFLVVGCSILY